MPDDLTRLSATRLAQRIAARELSSVEVVEAHMARIEAINGVLNALIWPMFETARDQAREADAAVRRGDPLGPLHGVPLTIKECFFAAGTPACLGVSRLREDYAASDGFQTRSLREAGGIILGKTNVPQLMLWHESDNPVYGRSNNPWNVDRTCGGSTGGEAALIAAYGSPLGLGNDLGGSIRIPAHFCGIHGFKPTSGRLVRRGARQNLRGMESLVGQPGPLARHVEDLELLFEVLSEATARAHHLGSAPLVYEQASPDSLEGLRVGWYTYDGYFAPSPAIRRAVREAVGALEAAGAVGVPFEPPAVPQILEAYYGIIAADGSVNARQLASGSPLDPRLRRMFRWAALPRPLRWILSQLLQHTGQPREGRLLAAARRCSAATYWQLTWKVRQYAERFLAAWDDQGLDAVVCPVHALCAFPHGLGVSLIPAASYSYLINLLGLPAGAVSLTRVGAGEESDRLPGWDRLERFAAQAEAASQGLPVAVQVVGRPWREDVVFCIMRALESAFRAKPDYPRL